MMKPILAGLILCFACVRSHALLAQSSAAPAQAARLKFAEAGTPYLRNYSPKEYKADAQNWAVVQNRDGVMYFANNYGVLEYDGVSWRTIPTSNNTVVRTLSIDAKGTIYVGARGEIGYLSPDSVGRLGYVSLRENIPEEYREFSDIAKCYTIDSVVYFQALDRLMLWSQGHMRVWKPATPFHLSFAVHGRLYVRQPGVGLLQMVDDSLHLAPQGERFSELRIYCMLPFDESRILIGTREQGLFLYDGKSAQPFPTEVNVFLLENQLYHGAVLSDGSFALATLRGGVVTINRAGELLQILNRASGLQDENVCYVLSDMQQGLWLALNNGITRTETPSPLSLFNERAGLQGSVEDLQRHQGRLYTATHQGVYYLRPRAEDQATAANVLPARFQPVDGIAAESWCLLSAGELLLAGTRESICQIVGDRVALARPSANHVYALYRSRRDSTLIYVGLADGLAALSLTSSPQNGRNQTRWKEIGRVNGIEAEVRSMVETNEGMLWLGTRSQGVVRVDFSSGFSRDPKYERMDSSRGLPAEPGWIIVFSAGEEEYFATDGGIFRFDTESQRFLKHDILQTAVGKNNRIVSEISLDHAGNMWLQADEQIFLAMQRPRGGYEWFDTPFKRCTDFPVWAILPEPGGEVWFGGPEGLVRYDAEVYKNYDQHFAALLRKVIVNQDSLLWAGATVAAILGQSGNAPAEQELRYAQNTLRFEFSATSYEDESANRYQYFLEDFDKGWSAWSHETIKDYTSISEGRYRFRVRARNIYEKISAEAVYAFRILPPWYRTWWAYMFYLGGMAGLILGFLKYRTRQLVQRSRMLENTVQERTEEIRQQAEELETLDGIVQNISREIDLENVLRSLLEQGLKLFPQAQKASVLRYDQASDSFRFVAAAGYDLDFLKSISFSPQQLDGRYTTGSEEVGEGVFIVRNLQSLYSQEMLNSVSLPASVLAMTVVSEGKREAYLVFDSLSNPDAFDHSDAHKLSRFRSHAISAIVKAKILQELQEKNSEILRTQQQLVMQEKLASLGALTAGIAHEIKNPLNFINNFAELSVELTHELQDELRQVQDQIGGGAAASISDILRSLGQNAQKINEHGKRADGIVRGMLQHSRTQTGERESTDLNALLQQAVSLSYHGMRAHEAGFNVSIEESYDAAVGSLAVMPQDLSRVFLNILNNACYAAYERKKRQADSFAPTLTVRTKGREDKVEIRIRDNGAGIPAAIRDKIFNPFFTTKPTGQGTGLGLSISYDIIQKHGGEISIDTEEGSHTEFIIILPRDGKR